GCRDIAQWVAGRYGISDWKARRWVAAGHALASLPCAAAALAAGTLSIDKVVELARVATPESEAKLVSWATRVTPRAIRRKADVAARASKEEVADLDSERALS